MEPEATVTATETPEAVAAKEAEAQEAKKLESRYAEEPAADTETADTEAGKDSGKTEEKTPEQIEAEKAAAAQAEAIAKSKAGTDPAVQKRIDKITRQAKLEAENAYLKGQLEAVEKFGLKPKAEAETEAKIASAAPNPYDFDLTTPEGTAAYIKANTDFNVQESLRQIETAKQQNAQKAEQAKAREAAKEAHTKFVNAGVAEYGEDFEDIVTTAEGVKISEHMADAIYDSEVAGHLMAMHLAKNPEESARIAALPKARQIREMLSLESKILAARQPKTTQTPPPVKPIKGGAATTVALNEITDMDDYAAARGGKKG